MIVAGIGLYLLSNAQTLVSALVAATVFFLGVCFVWPTMLGFVSERVPRSGALGLALMLGIGVVVGWLPALRGMRLRIVDALRRVA